MDRKTLQEGLELITNLQNDKAFTQISKLTDIEPDDELIVIEEDMHNGYKVWEGTFISKNGNWFSLRINDTWYILELNNTIIFKRKIEDANHFYNVVQGVNKGNSVIDSSVGLIPKRAVFSGPTSDIISSFLQTPSQRKTLEDIRSDKMKRNISKGILPKYTEEEIKQNIETRRAIDNLARQEKIEKDKIKNNMDKIIKQRIKNINDTVKDPERREKMVSAVTKQSNSRKGGRSKKLKRNKRKYSRSKVNLNRAFN